MHSSSWTRLIALASIGFCACSAGARFYSRTGREYPAVTPRALICDESNAQAVVAAGGKPIGTIAAKGYTVTATHDDVAEKAAIIAARNGGTHLILTEKGMEYFTTFNPATVEDQCVRDDGAMDCRTTYTPASETTYEKPTAKFVVFRVAPESWAQLPASLQPVEAH